MSKKKIKWACPKCGAEPDKHGKGGWEKCEERISTEKGCMGFLCECDIGQMLSEEHGELADDACTNAVCYHCGWGGTFPVPAVDPKKLRGWKKTAWEAGWRPKS